MKVKLLIWYKDKWVSLATYYILQKIEPSAIEDFYGLTTDIQKSSETGYILFYQSRDSAS